MEMEEQQDKYRKKKELEIRPGYNSSNVISFVELGH